MAYGENIRAIEDYWTFGVYGGDGDAVPEFIHEHADELWHLTSESTRKSLENNPAVNTEDVHGITRVIAHTNATSSDYFANILAKPDFAIRQRRLRPATYENQRLVVAWVGSQIGAFCLSENVTSSRFQHMKQQMNPAWPVVGGYQYAQQRLLAVRYASHGSGIAQAVGYKSIDQLDGRHKVTAFTWPDLFPHVDAELLKFSFQK